jgi:hypothetical protein
LAHPFLQQRVTREEGGAGLSGYRVRVGPRFMSLVRSLAHLPQWFSSAVEVMACVFVF